MLDSQERYTQGRSPRQHTHVRTHRARGRRGRNRGGHLRTIIAIKVGFYSPVMRDDVLLLQADANTRVDNARIRTHPALYVSKSVKQSFKFAR